MSLDSFFHRAKFFLTLRKHLKKYPALVAAKRKLSGIRFQRELGGKSCVDLINTFPMFKPYSAGTYKELAKLTILSINQTVPNLLRLAKTTNPNNTLLCPIMSFADTTEKQAAARNIKKCFDQYGSDKGAHDYHFLYGPILDNRDVSTILEIGLGTNNTDVASNMGARGRPGASLRAFRDFTGAKIFGADVDKRVLFQELGIETFYVDQTDVGTFEALSSNVSSAFDLVIDDGLHSTNANLATLDFGLTRIREGGWIVIEDIGRPALPLWELVSHMLQATLECHLLENPNGTIVFAAQKISK
ncbi:MAG: class I SAM-dependent methyltransferase [Betaproteobacteria bacterium]|nr:class I SAM-dependent methyltransferase [Betaproteobacteria bacterium]